MIVRLYGGWEYLSPRRENTISRGLVPGNSCTGYLAASLYLRLRLVIVVVVIVVSWPVSGGHGGWHPWAAAGLSAGFSARHLHQRF